MKMKTGDFKLMPTDWFDARRGYSRWVVPGVGVSTIGRESSAQADIWINPKGKLVTRFMSAGYSLHFEIKVIPEIQITNEMQEDIADFVTEMLITWVVEGWDDDLECDDVLYNE
jgi:hypothetical protein